MNLRRHGQDLEGGAAAVLILALSACVALDIVARWFGLPLTGGGLLGSWLLAFLAMAAACSALRPARGLRAIVAFAIAGFALQHLMGGFVSAAWRIGGTEPVLGLPVAWRYGGAALALALAIAGVLLRTPRGAAAMAAGAVAGAVCPAAHTLVGAALFALALVVRAPVALALIAAVALAPGALSEAALAQSVLRGLGPAVLIAVPLFILAAALMVAGGVGDGLVRVAAYIARTRKTAAAEANVFASLLFGGVSGSGIADAALGARLLVPPMVRAGHTPADAAALTAAAAIVPNLMPPSIALLLAAAATDQSVGRLWTAGIGAAGSVVLVLWLAVRLRPPAGTRAIAPPSPDLSVLVPPLIVVIAIVGGLRAGLVTATEAGCVAVILGGFYAALRRGPSALWSAAREAGLQAGRVALLIGAAAPVSFLLATSGVRWNALLPAGPAPVVLAAAAAIALAAGTVLDVGAAILLLLPILLPAATLAGADPIHATLVLVAALLIGGLTPPVGVLVITVKEITGANGVFRAMLPYLAALALALMLLIAFPWLTSGLASL